MTSLDPLETTLNNVASLLDRYRSLVVDYENGLFVARRLGFAGTRPAPRGNGTELVQIWAPIDEKFAAGTIEAIAAYTTEQPHIEDKGFDAYLKAGFELQLRMKNAKYYAGMAIRPEQFECSTSDLTRSVQMLSLYCNTVSPEKTLKQLSMLRTVRPRGTPEVLLQGERPTLSILTLLRESKPKT